MGLLVFQVHPVLGGKIVKGQQLLGVINDFRYRLRVLGAEQVGKRRDRLLGVLAILGVADLQRGPCAPPDAPAWAVRPARWPPYAPSPAPPSDLTAEGVLRERGSISALSR
jgi:hypothetical protein